MVYKKIEYKKKLKLKIYNYILKIKTFETY